MSKTVIGAQLLQEADAPRIMSPTVLHDWLQQKDITVSRRYVSTLMQKWVDIGVMDKVAHGVFLNKLAQPHPRPDEAAHFIRQDAVISLQRVLGDYGVLNNPSHWITCVLPTASGVSGGVLETNNYTFRFSTMSAKMLPNKTDAWYNDAFDVAAHVPTATPEKALLDWVYLASSRSSMPFPPKHDLDMELLDIEKIERLADHMNIRALWDNWITPPKPASKSSWRQC